MPGRVRVTIVQLDHDAAEPAGNAKALVEMVRKLPRSDVLVFPELALHGHRTPGPCRMSAPQLAPVEPDQVDAVRDAAQAAGTSVIYGALVQKGDRLLNMANVTQGGVTRGYAKTHVHWSEPFAPGTSFPVFDTPLGPTGLLVCFDSAFPEPARALALAGATVLVQISAVPGDFPIETMQRRAQAASVYNQVYTIYVNRRGHGFAGGSAVSDPRGVLVATAGAEDPILEVDLDLDAGALWREKEPTLRYRRPELYGALTRPDPPPLTGAIPTGISEPI